MTSDQDATVRPTTDVTTVRAAIDAAARRIAATAPPLTEDQAQRLARLFITGGAA